MLLFFWFVLINGIKQKKQYEEKATVKDAVIIKKSSRRQQVGARFSGKLYELEAMTDEGKKYHIETFSYRVRFYKEGQNVKIIVPNNLKEYVLSDEKEDKPHLHAQEGLQNSMLRMGWSQDPFQRWLVQRHKRLPHLHHLQKSTLCRI